MIAGQMIRFRLVECMCRMKKTFHSGTCGAWSATNLRRTLGPSAIGVLGGVPGAPIQGKGVAASVDWPALTSTPPHLEAHAPTAGVQRMRHLPKKLNFCQKFNF